MGYRVKVRSHRQSQRLVTLPNVNIYSSIIQRQYEIRLYMMVAPYTCINTL